MTGERGRRVATLASLAGGAAVAELLLLRVTTRTLIHIPDLDRAGPVLDWLMEAGRLAYYLSLVAAVALAIHVAGTALRGAGPVRWAAPAAIGLFLAGAGVAVLAPGWGGVVAGWALVGAVGLLLAAVPASGRLTLGLAAAAVTTGAVVGLAQAHHQAIGGGLFDILIGMSEGLAVAAALASPCLLEGRLSRRAVVGGVVAGAVVLAALTLARPTLAIVSLWAVGLPTWLPAPLLAAGGGALTATLIESYPRDRALAAGLSMMVCGGVGLISTYQSALVVTGMAVAVSRLADRPSPVPLSTRPVARRRHEPLSPPSLAMAPGRES